jgi:hypothetical protein
MVRRGSTVRVRQRAYPKCLLPSEGLPKVPAIQRFGCPSAEHADTFRTHLRYARRTAASRVVSRRIIRPSIIRPSIIRPSIIRPSTTRRSTTPRRASTRRRHRHHRRRPSVCATTERPTGVSRHISAPHTGAALGGRTVSYPKVHASGYGQLNGAGFRKNQYVRSYLRRDGTFVNGYWRNSPTDGLPTCRIIHC